MEETTLRYKLDNGDNVRTRLLFDSQDLQQLNEYVQDYELLAIDEAQRIENIGWGLKLLKDHHPDLRIIATGSSSFHLSQGLGEPLTGRKRAITLYPLSDRNDIGALFENFIVMEFVKSNAYKEKYADLYFWRTHGGEEIDLIEDQTASSKLTAFEIKWNDRQKVKIPKSWKSNYTNSEFKVLNRENYLDFLL